MSSNLPPQGPHGEPGRPGAEYLDPRTGAPIPPGSDRGEEKKGRRTPLIVGGALVAGLLVVGGGTLAAVQLAGGGDQPSEALPAGTLGYVSVDLDPSADQKIEAMRIIKKFPAADRELGMDARDDLRKRLFEEIQADGECEDLDYDADIAPWLGDRAALAGVRVGDEPVPVGVLAIKDADAAEKGIEKLRACGDGEGGDSEGGFVIADDWLVFSDTREQAQAVVDLTEEQGPLADDEDFQQWTGEVGDPGIVTMYASPDAGGLLAESFDDLAPVPGAGSSAYSDEELERMREDMVAAGMTEEQADEYVASMAGSGAAPGLGAGMEDAQEQAKKALEEFRGAAATVRFDDGGVELVLAGATPRSAKGLAPTAGGGDLVGTLPADTLVAFGASMPDGWLDLLMEQMASMSGGQLDAEELYRQMEAQTGLELPEDAETLTGESLAVALGDGFDPEAMVNSSDGSDVPIGVKIQGDADEIEKVLDKLRASAGMPEDGPLRSVAEGDVVVVGPNAEYLEKLAAEGDLAASEAYEDVAGEADDAGMVLFVDFDGSDDWLAQLAGDDPRVKENLEPLSALGLTSWTEGDVNHAELRLTTD